MYARLGKQVLPTMSSTEIEAIHTYVYIYYILYIACIHNGIYGVDYAIIHGLVDVEGLLRRSTRTCRIQLVIHGPWKVYILWKYTFCHMIFSL